MTVVCSHAPASGCHILQPAPQIQQKTDATEGNYIQYRPQHRKEPINILVPQCQNAKDQSDQRIDRCQHTGDTVSSVHHASLTVGQIRHNAKRHQADDTQNRRHDRFVRMFFIRKNVVLFPHNISPMEPEKGTSYVEMPILRAQAAPFFSFVLRTGCGICRR